MDAMTVYRVGYGLVVTPGGGLIYIGDLPQILHYFQYLPFELLSI